MRIAFYFAFIFCAIACGAQTLGGNAVFNFLKLPPTALQSATGGINVSLTNTDAGSVVINPAQLTQALDGQAAFSFNNLFKTGNALHAAGVKHLKKKNFTAGVSVLYVDYGTLAQTDAGGNNLGTFEPRDYAVQFAAAKAYGNHWNYGINIKFIASQYGMYNAAAVAADVGLHYSDTFQLFAAGFVVRNMGGMINSYGNATEELPFEIVAGISKKLKNAPIGFSITGQYLHRLRISNADSLLQTGTNKLPIATELFNHVILATHVYINKYLQLHIGYNALRSFELKQSIGGSGLNGFGGGFVTSFNKFGLQYGRSYYSRQAYNQLSLTLQIKKLLATGL